MVNEVRENHIMLPDARTLAYAEYGPPNGPAIVYCHGFPSSRIEAQLLGPAIDALGARVIAPDRPGYGGSDPASNRSLADFAADVVILLDRLGVAQAAVLGVSGGGPYALALLALYPERFSRAALVAALGPPEALAAVHERLPPVIRRAWRAAQRYPVLIPVGASLGVGILRLRSRFELNAQFVSPSDVIVLADPEVRGLLRHSQREGLRQGGRGAVQDLALYMRPWGFRLATVRAPLTIWHGEADQLVPVDMAEHIATCVGHSRVRRLPGEGHYSLPIRYREAIMRSVLEDR